MKRPAKKVKRQAGQGGWLPLLVLLRKFRDDRDWKQFHNPKDLAAAIAIEAGELQEHFLWKTRDEVAADLAAAGMARCESWGCEFDSLADGTTIHPAWREAIRRRHAGFTEIANPFDTTTQPHLLSLYRSIERGAHKWRKEWLLKWPREQGIAGQVRKANKTIKNVLRLFRGSKSA